MTAHQQKKKIGRCGSPENSRSLKLPLSDEAVTHVEFYRPPEDSPEMRYVHQRYRGPSGPLPTRVVKPIEIKAPALETFKERWKAREAVSVDHVSFRFRDQVPAKVAGVGQAGSADHPR